MFKFTPNLPDYTLGKFTGLLPFKLFTLVKEGHLAPLDGNGEPILPPDLLYKAKRLEEIANNLKEIRLVLKGKKQVRFPDHWNVKTPKEAKEKVIQYRERLINESKTLLQELEGRIENKCSWASYNLPGDPKQRQQVFDLLSDATYLIKDIVAAKVLIEENILVNNTIHSEQEGTTNKGKINKLETEASQLETKVNVSGEPVQEITKVSEQPRACDEKSEDFVLNLRVSFSSDTSIFLQPKSKTSQEYSCKEMGFKSNAETWKLLMEVLQNSTHEYYVGPYSKDKLPEKNRDYHKKIANMKEFSKKFVSFLNQTYSAQIPEKFNIFENKHMTGEDRPGTYVPKFRVTSPDVSLGELSKEEILKSIKDLSKQYKKEDSGSAKGRLAKQIKLYVDHALSKGWTTKQEYANFLLSDDGTPSSHDALADLPPTVFIPPSFDCK